MVPQFLRKASRCRVKQLLSRSLACGLQSLLCASTNLEYWVTSLSTGRSVLEGLADSGMRAVPMRHAKTLDKPEGWPLRWLAGQRGVSATVPPPKKSKRKKSSGQKLCILLENIWMKGQVGSSGGPSVPETEGTEVFCQLVALRRAPAVGLKKSWEREQEVCYFTIERASTRYIRGKVANSFVPGNPSRNWMLPTAHRLCLWRPTPPDSFHCCASPQLSKDTQPNDDCPGALPWPTPSSDRSS